MCDVGCTQASFEAEFRVEAMYPRVGAAALQQDVVTVGLPSQAEQIADDGATMAFTLPVRTGGDVFEETVPPAATQQIGRSNQCCGCNDRGIDDRHRYMGRFQFQ